MTFCLTQLISSALGRGLAESVNFNVGTHTEYFNNVQVNSTGGTRKFDFAPMVGVGVVIPIANHFRFLPEMNWVLPQLNSESEKRIIKNTFMLRGDIAYDPLEWLRLRLGTSIMHQNQQGRGGKAKVNNGNGHSTFYYPDENRSSINNTVDVGIEGMFKKWSIRLQTYTYAILSSERRQLSYTLMGSYYWDQ